MTKRVVITGIGMITPIGLTRESSWDALINGRSGITKLTRFDGEELKIRIAGEVKDFRPEDHIPPKEVKKMDTFIHYAIASAKEAMNDSGLTVDERNAARVGCIMGTGLGGLPEIEKAKMKLARTGRTSPFFIPMVIGNLAPAHLAIHYGMKGPNLSIATACASGLHAIGEAYRYIKNGICDAMLTGGSESALSPLAFTGFNSMRAISRRNDEPEKASRPFDRDRDGFVIAEGAGVLVLEDYELAINRNVPIYAEIVGYGTSCDAYHITTPNVEGAALCMRNALQESGIPIEDYSYINAHGTSTYYNDINETKAVLEVFGSHAAKLMISSNKSMIGHCLGAAGGIETSFTALTIARSIIPPTINLDNPDPLCTLDYVPGTAREKEVTAALCNSFGFGGTNGILALRKI